MLLQRDNTEWIFRQYPEPRCYLYFILKWFIYVCVCPYAHTCSLYKTSGHFAFSFFSFRTILQEARLEIKNQNQFFLLQKISIWDPVKYSLWQMQHPSGLYRYNITFFFFALVLPLCSSHQHKMSHSQSPHWYLVLSEPQFLERFSQF